MTTTQATATIFEHVATSEEAVGHFSARLAFETDVSDVRAGLAEAEPGFTVVDTRNDASWAQGRVPGAVHLPTRQIRERAAELIAPGSPVVVYCWGPGCNGAQRAALEFALLGHPVKEMIGGFEYWVREGFPVDTEEGTRQGAADPLTNVASTGLALGPAGDLGITCAC
ncbi:rhodanese-like domain-containing protein [Agromyces sp. MMS24-K17]|uniref:rhodanese-like domain-containing protein n=1 Tax=Agromyces sp. MMS24-K17 TaxID=3372850 RepID=UPI003753F200